MNEQKLRKPPEEAENLILPEEEPILPEEEKDAPEEEKADAALPADLRSQVEMARILYPDLKEIPPEVAKDVAEGSNFLLAYALYRTRELDRLRQENAALRRSRETRNRAVVRGVSGGRTEPVSDFERGFDSDTW